MRVTLCAILIVFGPHASHAADPPLPKLENLPADAEVHAVAVSEPVFAALSYKEITDWQGLVKALRAKDGPAAYISKLLPESAHEVLTEDVEKGKIDDPKRLPILRRKVELRLSTGLTQALQDHVFYDADAFAKVELPKSVKELVALGDKRTTFQTERMNRELLVLACPKCIAPTPADFQTVRVTVKPGKPVVLVTSSYSQCRWVVTVEKGANVVGVVQIGNFAQEVTGTDASVVYAAGRRPNGEKGPTIGFNAHVENDGLDFKRVKATVKQITDREFTKFQGKYQSEKEPFVVTPGK